MKASTPTLLDILASRQVLYADLFKIETVDGTILRYARADTDLILSGDTYSSGGIDQPLIVWDFSNLSWNTGLEVSSASFEIIPREGMINGKPYIQMVRAGFLDGATVTISRAYMTSYAETVTESVPLFTGVVGDVRIGDLIEINLLSRTIEFQRKLPGKTYQPTCVNTLFDTACGVTANSFKVTASCLPGTIRSAINMILPQPAGYYNLGKIVSINGVNQGFSRSIKAWSGSTLTLFSPFPFDPNISDGFDVYPGCDKSNGSTGCAKFSNTARFRGFRFIPQPETAV